ncbi:unnamed protein product [Candida verbasci]|uniref:DNA topoisomerase I n=1 Tax=Candida verbasci TaxID=1227364 RepID=A0A9W4XCJ5_9ASCO|nr:unnamed protein product [Candida verbasci]
MTDLSSSEDEMVLSQLAKNRSKSKLNSSSSSTLSTSPTSNDDNQEQMEDVDEIPLASNKLSKRARKKSVIESDDDVKDEDEDEDEFVDEKPLKKRKLSNGSKKSTKSTTKPTTKVKKESKSTTVKKESKSTKQSKTKSEPESKANGQTTSKVKKEDSVKEETPLDDDDAGYKWWEEGENDGVFRWESLEHNGVIFPPPYEPLPSYVKMYYNGKPVNLPPEAEEVAGFYAALLETDHGKNPVFQKNFFNDFVQVLKECGGCGVEIKRFDKCDFTKMFAYFEKLKEEKKQLTRDEKKRIKEEKEKMEEPFKTCILNGRKELVGNFRIEPPGLFRGRGAHPKTGKLKRRVYPEQVTLNLSKGAKIPEAPAGHNWAEIKHDNEVTWLAMWKENIADSFKYVRFAANSSIKGQSDFKKFEKARKLHNHVEAIRKDYSKLLTSEKMQDRQMGTAMHLIDKFALRAGGEKGDDEADTVGCCSLRYEHVTLKKPNTVIFDFLGKDSIRFYLESHVERQIFKNLKIFKKPPKQPGDDLFDRINPSMVNKQLQNYMEGLTAKVFRTYNASKVFQDQIDKLDPNEGTVAEKVVKFNAANRAVAILCNHQRTVSKNHDNTVQKINDKLKESMWQKIRLKKIILQLNPKLKQTESSYFEEIEDLIPEEIENIVENIITRQTEQVNKKMIKDNEKLKLEKKPLLTKSDFKDKFDKIKELEKEYKKEINTGKPEVPAKATVEKLKQQVETIENRIINISMQLKDKKDNSEVSLGTSKLNYIDPRLTVVFSKKFGVPIEKLFTKTLRDKFKWAIESVDENWQFCTPIDGKK